MYDLNKDLMKIETESLAFNTPYIILTIFWLITECNERNGVPLFCDIPFVFSKLFTSPEKFVYLNGMLWRNIEHLKNRYTEN